MRVITGSARGVQLLSPNGQNTRPTADRVKEGLFSAIQFELAGARVLDLFAGTGQLGIEALSRGAEFATFVDHSADAVKLVRENLRRTGLSEKAEVIQSDYLSFLQNLHKQYDIIFLDPPYAENFLEIAMNFIVEIDILRDRGIIVCEKAAMKQLTVEKLSHFSRRDYRYGQVSLSVYRKDFV